MMYSISCDHFTDDDNDEDDEPGLSYLQKELGVSLHAYIASHFS